MHGATCSLPVPLLPWAPDQDLVLEVGHTDVEASKNALNIPEQRQRSGEACPPRATGLPAFQLAGVSTTSGIHDQGQLCRANCLCPRRCQGRSCSSRPGPLPQSFLQLSTSGLPGETVCSIFYSLDPLQTTWLFPFFSDSISTLTSLATFQSPRRRREIPSGCPGEEGILLPPGPVHCVLD